MPTPQPLSIIAGNHAQMHHTNPKLHTEPAPNTPLASQPDKYVSVPVNDPSLADDANAAPVYPVQPSVTAQGHTPHVASLEEYRRLYERSIKDPAGFFGDQARDLLTWSKDFGSNERVTAGSFAHGDVQWFADGELNASYNCVDRWATRDPERVAIIWEPDDAKQGAVKVTYGQLLREVSQLANAFKALGLRQGDTVGIYLPMIPQAAVAMLACARLGLIHSVVFAGFSSEALRDRLVDAKCRVLITSDESMRAGKVIPIKRIADEALKDAPSVEKVLVVRRTGSAQVAMRDGRDLWYDEELKRHRPYCPPVNVSGEAPLFMLYTSGSTGKPKGLLHTTAGYLLGAAMTVKYVFDTHQGDVYGCMADIGWVTGHTYSLYGPLCLGVTTVFFESIPTYPTPSRYWEVVQKHKITQFYTSPTAIRALMRFGDDPAKGYDLSSIRVLGTVGEPINPAAWEWYFRVAGREKTAIVDTYWQTETGSNILTPLPGAIPTKPGSATLPFFGIQPAIVDANTGIELEGPSVTGVLCVRSPWPSMARTIFGDHDRFLSTYHGPYKNLYFTGDGATRDKDGYYWIRGRVDDVINVSGHRMSTAEVESALVAHETCAEAAVVGAPDDVTGQSIAAFVTLKTTHIPISEIPTLLKSQVRTVIGPIATPKRIIITPDLPKTRSGKIMRRILRKIAAGEENQLGDTSTLADPNIVQVLIEKWKATS